MRVFYHQEDARTIESVICTACKHRVRITKDGRYQRHKNIRRSGRPYAHNPDCPNNGKKVENL